MNDCPGCYELTLPSGRVVSLCNIGVHDSTEGIQAVVDETGSLIPKEGGHYLVTRTIYEHVPPGVKFV